MARRPICLVCLMLMLCMCLADLAGIPLIRGNPLPRQTKDYIEGHPKAVIVGEVQQCQATEFSFSVYLKNVSLADQPENNPIYNVRVFLKNKEDLPAGTFVKAEGKLERVAAPRNPGEFDSRQYYACQHIYYFMKNAVIKKKSSGYSFYRQFMQKIREKLGQALKKCAGKDASLFEAMLLGEKSNLEEERKLRYQMAGMIHILAISGLHISILGMGLFSFLKKAGLGNGGAGFLALFIMLQYGMLTGGSISAMRSVCMFVLAVGAKITGRIYDLLTALALSAILLLLDAPACLYSSSFLLSFGAVVGLSVLAPYLMRLLEIKGKIGKALISSIAVQTASLPISLLFFGQVSIAGIFLNLLVLPTVGGVLLSGLCCSILGLFCQELGMVAALPGRILLWLYEITGSMAGAFPFCTWIGGTPKIWQIIFYYILLTTGIFLGLVIKRRKKNQQERKGEKFFLFQKYRSLILAYGILAAFLGSGIFVLSWKMQKELRITCLDVGQGDGIVVETPEKQVFLIDFGSSNKKNTAQYQLFPYLKSRGISYIDGIFISHTDGDHISGILEFLEMTNKNLTSIKVGALLLPDWKSPPKAYEDLALLAKKSGIKVIRTGEGDRFTDGETKFSVLAPEEGAEGKNVNEEGMVIELEHKGFRGIFTGDIGMETEKNLLGSLRDVDFLKTAHHGSRYSTGEEFLKQAKPELAVISCSDSNTYGHPSPETTLRLKEEGVQVEYTMKSGAITIGTDGEQIWVERFCEREEP